MILSTLYTRYIHLASGAIALCAIGLTATAATSDVEALYKAAGDGESTRVVSLVKGGVNVNGRTRSGSYALNAAAVENDIDVIRILLDHGADPNVQNSQGDTPLICATKYAGGKAATVELLVKAGTNLDIRHNQGKTTLDYAKAKRQQEAIAMLERSRN